MIQKRRPCLMFCKACIAVLIFAGLFPSLVFCEETAAVVQSQFIAQMSKAVYPAVSSPVADPLFRWDFSKAKVVHEYTYEQEVRNRSELGSSLVGESGSMGQEMSADGMLLIRSVGDHTAELVLKDMKMKAKMDMGQGEPKTMEQQMPPFVVQGMKEDSSAPYGNSSMELLLKMLFPLPPEPLKVGTSVDVPAQMPFNAIGSVLQVTGRSRITLAGYVKIKDRICARLNVDTDISKLKLPEELKGEYKCSVKGLSVFYFDIESRAFVSGEIAMMIAFSIDAPIPQMKIEGENGGKLPKRTQMSMKSDNFIRVKSKK